MSKDETKRFKFETLMQDGTTNTYTVTGEASMLMALHQEIITPTVERVIVNNKIKYRKSR